MNNNLESLVETGELNSTTTSLGDFPPPEGFDTEEAIAQAPEITSNESIEEVTEETVEAPKAPVEPAVDKVTHKPEVEPTPVETPSISKIGDAIKEALQPVDPKADEPVEEVEEETPEPKAEVAQVVESADSKEAQAFAQGLSQAVAESKQHPTPEAPDLMHPSLTSSQDKINLRRRLSGPIYVDTIQVKPIHNRTLSYFLGSFRKTHQIDEELPVQGCLITRTKSTGIWEEGGATADEGSVLVATDPNGRKLTPVIVYHTPNIVNGRRALVPAWTGCYLLLGGHRKGELILVVYKIESIKYIEDSSVTYPRFICRAIAYVAGAEWHVLDEKSIDFWNPKHPAVRAALARITEQHATTPCYVAPYREHFFDNNLKMDFVDCLKDQEFFSKIKDYENLDDAYLGAEVWLGDEVAKSSKSEHVLLLTWINDRPQDKAVMVFLLGIVYDVDKHSSKGKRLWYGRVTLREGSQFYYADRSPEEAIPFERMRADLIKPPYNGKSLITLRRMLEARKFN